MEETTRVVYIGRFDTIANRFQLREEKEENN